MKKYLVVACKDVCIDGKWFIKTSNFEVDAENETVAEWKIRSDGYSPLTVREIYE